MCFFLLHSTFLVRCSLFVVASFCALFILACAATWAAAAEVPTLAWTTARDLRAVKAVFCHPTDPAIAYLAGAEGLLKTDDDGRSWKPLPAAAGEKIGLVTALACSPTDEKLLVLGTNDRGLWLSADGGQALKRIGDGAERPAGAHIESVAFYAVDPSWRSLLTGHGTAAAGLSISRDLGATWQVVADDRYFRDVASLGDNLVASASMVLSEGKVWGLHCSMTDGLRWEESSRRIGSGRLALSPLSPWRFYFAASSGSVLQSPDEGVSWQPVNSFQGASWVSLFFAFGRTDGAEILAGYDPHQQGLVVSSRRFARGSGVRQNQGLYVGPYVKSGSSCAANANGSTYYVVANDALWTGRRPSPDKAPSVAQAWCRPSALWLGGSAGAQARQDVHEHVRALAAADGVRPADVRALAQANKTSQALSGGAGLTVLARVAHAGGPSAIKTVTVDASALGQGVMELFNDGRHDDGQSGDDLWGGQLAVAADIFNEAARQRRRPLPGLTALTVSAIDKQGASDSWTAVVSLQDRPSRLAIFDGGLAYKIGKEVDSGPAGMDVAAGQGVRTGTPALCVSATGGGPWRGGIAPIDWGGIYGRDYLVFQIKGDVNQEILVQMVDNHHHGEDQFDEPHLSAPVALLGGGYLKAIAPTYQKVRIPVKALLTKDVFFLRAHGGGIALSAPAGGKPGKYYLDEVALEP